MKPRVKIATASTPDGGEMVLFQHDLDFFIKIDGQDLMHSRHHESELELARLGCAHLINHKNPSVLIGGLGMGYTLRQALDILSPHAHVLVGELMDAVIKWNREYLGELNDNPLSDERVTLKRSGIVELISQSKNTFDVILLDIDNGPSAMTDSGNSRLYGYEGILSCHRALREKGCLAVWSADPSKDFEQILTGCGFHVRHHKVPARKGTKSLSRFIWIASKDESAIPPGDGRQRQPIKRTPKGSHKRHRVKS